MRIAPVRQFGGRAVVAGLLVMGGMLSACQAQGSVATSAASLPPPALPNSVAQEPGQAPPIITRDFAAEAATAYLTALINNDPSAAGQMWLQGHTADDDSAMQQAAQAMKGCDPGGLHTESTMAVPQDTVTATFTPPCGNVAAIDPGAPPGPIAECTVDMRTFIGSWVPTSAPSCGGSQS